MALLSPVDEPRGPERFNGFKIRSVSRLESPISLAELKNRFPPEAAEHYSQPSIEEMISEARALIGLGMLDDAHERLLAAKNEDRFRPEVHFNLGELWTDRKQYEKAVEAYKVALNLDPGAIAPLVRLAAVTGAIYEPTQDRRFRSEAVL